MMVVSRRGTSGRRATRSAAFPPHAPLQILQRAALERVPPGKEVEKQHADAIRIALVCRLLALEHLWSQIERHTGNVWHFGQPSRNRSRHQNPSRPAGRLADHDVPCLHVAMHRTRGMDRVECIAAAVQLL